MDEFQFLAWMDISVEVILRCHNVPHPPTSTILATSYSQSSFMVTYHTGSSTIRTSTTEGST